MTRFALVTLDELWVGGPAATRLEERLVHGVANDGGARIDATDARDDELVVLCEQNVGGVQRELRNLRGARVRIIGSARRIGPVVRTDLWVVVTAGRLSVVSSPRTLSIDYVRLMRAAETKPRDSAEYRGVPIVWRGGSGAVLLHEAVGHAAEHRADATVKWPAWLSVRDEPDVQLDDAGLRCTPADLLAGQPPTAMRRASFADVPLPRMTNLVVRQSGAPFALPAKRIEIDLVAAGSYDALTDRIRVSVAAAELVDGRSRRPIAPFEISESRQAVGRAMTGALGEPDRYPGVVCSLEGQELIVGSWAPVLTTVFDV